MLRVLPQRPKWVGGAQNTHLTHQTPPPVPQRSPASKKKCTGPSVMCLRTTQQLRSSRKSPVPPTTATRNAKRTERMFFYESCSTKSGCKSSLLIGRKKLMADQVSSKSQLDLPPHVTCRSPCSSAVVTLSSVRFESTQTLGNLSSQPIAACRAPAAARSPSHPGPRGAARCAALGARTAPPGRNSWGERCGGARLNALFRKPALAVDRRREGARLVPFFGDGQS